MFTMGSVNCHVFGGRIKKKTVCAKFLFKLYVLRFESICRKNKIKYFSFVFLASVVFVSMNSEKKALFWPALAF